MTAVGHSAGVLEYLTTLIHTVKEIARGSMFVMVSKPKLLS